MYKFAIWQTGYFSSIISENGKDSLIFIGVIFDIMILIAGILWKFASPIVELRKYLINKIVTKPIL
jgi:hypothetical protein